MKRVALYGFLLLGGCASVPSKDIALKTASDPEHVWKPTDVVAQKTTERTELPVFEPQSPYSLTKLIELGLSKNPQTRVAWWSAQKS